MNAAYASHFDAGRRPARTCIGVTALAKGALVEIDFVARRPEQETQDTSTLENPAILEQLAEKN